MVGGLPAKTVAASKLRTNAKKIPIDHPLAT
jgi:hypothetical protein